MSSEPRERNASELLYHDVHVYDRRYTCIFLIQHSKFIMCCHIISYHIISHDDTLLLMSCYNAMIERNERCCEVNGVRRYDRMVFQYITNNCARSTPLAFNSSSDLPPGTIFAFSGPAAAV